MALGVFGPTGVRRKLVTGHSLKESWLLGVKATCRVPRISWESELGAYAITLYIRCGMF